MELRQIRSFLSIAEAHDGLACRPSWSRSERHPQKTEIERAFLERLNLEAQSRLAEMDDFCRATEVQRLRERKKRTNMSKLHAA